MPSNCQGNQKSHHKNQQQQQQQPPSSSESLTSDATDELDCRDTASVLDKLMRFHQHHHARNRDASTGSLHRTLSAHSTALEQPYMTEECDKNDYHLDLDAYKPVEPLKYDHGVSLFPVAAPHTGMDLHLLQVLKLKLMKKRKVKKKNILLSSFDCIK